MAMSPRVSATGDGVMQRFLMNGSALVVLALASLQTVSAQTPVEDATASSEEVVVTARKRSERLFDVPAAVTAITPQQVEQLRLRDARDLLTLVPSAYLQENNAGTARDISIRGVSTPNLFAEPGVALYVDDVYSSGFISYPTKFYDLERVEVLRGPQGGLYGRNAVGGAVNVMSRRPDGELGGELTATYASFERWEVQGAANLPLGEDFAVRAVGWYSDQGEGEYFNPVTGDYLDRNRSSGGRISASYTPNADLSFLLLAETDTGKGGGTYLFFPTAGESKGNVPRDTQPVNEYDAQRYVAQAELETSAGGFTLVLGRREYQLDGIEDTDLSDQTAFGSPNAALGQQITTRRNDSQGNFAELRWLSPEFGSVQVLGGVTYVDDKAFGGILTNLQGLSNAFTGGALPATLAIDNNQKLTSWAGFADISWAVTETIDVTASLRYTEDKKSVDFLFTPSFLVSTFLGPSQARVTTRSFDQFSPGLTIAWKPSDDWRVYAKVQTGFRAGGFNFNVANAANLPYEEETSINYELGAKTKFADGRGTVGLTVYFLEQDDVLVPLFDLAAPGPLGGYLANVGEAETFGAELEGSFRLTDELTFGANVAYLDGSFTAGAVNGAILDGKQLPAARKWTASLTASYRTPVGGDMYLIANGSYTFRTKGFQDAANTQTIGGNDLVNLSAGLEFGHIELTGFVQNALDDEYDIAFGGLRSPNQSGVIRAQGRSFGVTAKAKF
jgi:iron complex outermembrane receptor protein